MYCSDSRDGFYDCVSAHSALVHKPTAKLASMSCQLQLPLYAASNSITAFPNVLADSAAASIYSKHQHHSLLQCTCQQHSCLHSALIARKAQKLIRSFKCIL